MEPLKTSNEDDEVCVKRETERKENIEIVLLLKMREKERRVGGQKFFFSFKRTLII